MAYDRELDMDLGMQSIRPRVGGPRPRFWPGNRPPRHGGRPMRPQMRPAGPDFPPFRHSDPMFNMMRDPRMGPPRQGFRGHRPPMVRFMIVVYRGGSQNTP